MRHHHTTRPSPALRFPSTPPAGRVAEPGSLGRMSTRFVRLIVAAIVLIFLIGTSFFFSTNTPAIELRIRRYANNEQGERSYAVIELVNRTDLPVSYFPDWDALRETSIGSLDPDYIRTGGYTGPAPHIAAGGTLTFRYYKLGGSKTQVVFRTYDLPIWVRTARKLPFSIIGKLPDKCWLPREQVFTLKV